jgi:hypothetical protein
MVGTLRFAHPTNADACAGVNQAHEFHGSRGINQGKRGFNKARHHNLQGG